MVPARVLENEQITKCRDPICHGTLLPCEATNPLKAEFHAWRIQCSSNTEGHPTIFSSRCASVWAASSQDVARKTTSCQRVMHSSQAGASSRKWLFPSLVVDVNCPGLLMDGLRHPIAWPAHAVVQTLRLNSTQSLTTESSRRNTRNSTTCCHVPIPDSYGSCNKERPGTRGDTFAPDGSPFD